MVKYLLLLPVGARKSLLTYRNLVNRLFSVGRWVIWSWLNEWCPHFAVRYLFEGFEPLYSWLEVGLEFEHWLIRQTQGLASGKLLMNILLALLFRLHNRENRRQLEWLSLFLATKCIQLIRSRVPELTQLHITWWIVLKFELQGLMGLLLVLFIGFCRHFHYNQEDVL